MTANEIINKGKSEAFAYIRVADRASWLRGWRQTARRVHPATLRNLMEQHVKGLRLAADQRSHRVVGTGYEGGGR